MIIKSLTLRNLQSHKDTYLEFDLGVNIIVGTSDSGKSAILRGFNKVINNKPSGGLRQHRSKETEIILTLDDSNITRLITNTKNEYQINNEKPFKAFGQGVPEEVTKVLNIQSINFQQQLDPPFLLDNTPGEVARTLNQAVNLDVIDRALSNITKQSRDNQQEIKTAQAQIEQFEKGLIEFDHLPQFEKDIQKLESVDKESKKIQDKRVKLVVLIDQHKGISAKLLDLSNFLTIEGKVRVLGEKASRRDAIAEKQGNLADIISSIGSLEAEIEKYRKITRAGREVTRLIGLDGTYKKASKKSGELYYLIGQTQGVHRDIKIWESDLDKLKKQFHKLMPDICPLCERKI